MDMAADRGDRSVIGSSMPGGVNYQLSDKLVTEAPSQRRQIMTRTNCTELIITTTITATTRARFGVCESI